MHSARELVGLVEQDPFLAIYVFGSVLKTNNGIGDLDLLVVYDDQSDLMKAKRVIREIGLKIPVDVIYMQQSEERELRFISRRGARSIVDLWPNKSFKPTDAPLRSASAV